MVRKTDLSINKKGTKNKDNGRKDKKGVLLLSSPYNQSLRTNTNNRFLG